MRNTVRQPRTEFADGATWQAAPGDLVRTGENFHPHYRVIAVTGDKAWIRDVQYGSDHIVPADRCRAIESPPSGNSRASF